MASLIVTKGSQLEVFANVTKEEACARFVDELYEYAKADYAHGLRIGAQGSSIHAMNTEYIIGREHISMSLDFEDDACYTPSEIEQGGALPPPEGGMH